MNVAEALDLLNQSLQQHGLSNWTGGLDNARRRFGVCRIDKKHISLSRTLCELNDRAEVYDTILHEIAHALAWQRHGENCAHDKRWKAICVEIGARPVACYDGEVIQPAAPWVLVHRDTGEVFRSYHKKPRRNWSTVWIRGRKADTLGKLEIRACDSDGKTSAVESGTSTPSSAFTAGSVAAFRKGLLEHVEKYASDHGLAISGSKGSYSDQGCEITLNFNLAGVDPVDTQRLEFEALAAYFALAADDYLRRFTVNGRAFRLIGFKPNNRKYPVIGVDETGQKYKFEKAVLATLKQTSP